MDLTKSYEFFKPDRNMGRVHIIGCGSVGSTVAENIARFGITKLDLWDFDTVEAHNVSNQMFRQTDVGKSKVKALKGLLTEINPDIVRDLHVHPDGWDGQRLEGYVFLCVDNIELRQKIVRDNFNNMFIKAMFDFRTRLTDAQHYAADWSDYKMRKSFLASMGFTHNEAGDETPVSACGVSLSVCPTIRVIGAYGVANFINFVNKGQMKKMILIDAFNFAVDAF